LGSFDINSYLELKMGKAMENTTRMADEYQRLARLGEQTKKMKEKSSPLFVMG